LHYFRHELGRDTVSVGEFSETLQKVLARLGLSTQADVVSKSPAVETDMRMLASEAGKSFELAFFNLLREELKRQLTLTPQVVRFTGLRDCVKCLLGARRWNEPCRRLSDQIVGHLRSAFQAEKAPADCTLIIE
jgi:hypothetical protein